MPNEKERNAPKRQEMAVASGGLQPAVVMKQGNACGAKGHSQEISTKDLTGQGSRCAHLINAYWRNSKRGVMPMEQQSDYLKSEGDLRKLLDDMYQQTQEAIQKGDLPKFKNLLEIISSEVVILTAIHNIKANKGSQTPGSDKETMRKNILEQDYPEVISRVKESLKWYKPTPVRRVWIPKPGKQEERPLGIPSIIDRVVQECVRIVIEPILEAQFFAHSYGFRPMRDAQMALERVTVTVHSTGYPWIIEGDISKFFDNVNHTKLIKKLWHMGVRDRRVLMVIKAMLKAGIMEEITENPLGTPQGGIISPLLANAYLHTLDKWIIREWEEKETKTSYSTKGHRTTALKARSNLKPAYLIRYADDWVLITDTKSNAEKWKKRIAKYLNVKLKLTLSEEKTLITNVRKKPIHFLGFTFKAVQGKSRNGTITKTRPDGKRMKAKVTQIRQNIKAIKKATNKEQLIHQINIVNSQIRGLCEYYQAATWVNIDLAKYADTLLITAYCNLRKYGGKWTPANQVNNLIAVHSQYSTQIPAIEYNGLKVGVTSLAFVKWKMKQLKNQDETPYTANGREKYQKRTGKKQLLARADDLLSLHLSDLIAKGLTGDKYNLEYFLNRAYAFNRDKGKCRVCGIEVQDWNVHIHHIQPKLPQETVNRVPNLATVHQECHKLIHDNQNHANLGKKLWAKILRFREKLSPTVQTS